MLHLIKSLEIAPDKTLKIRFIITKRKFRHLKRDLKYAYGLAKNPIKFDFEFMFDESDMP